MRRPLICVAANYTGSRTWGIPSEASQSTRVTRATAVVEPGHSRSPVGTDETPSSDYTSPLTAVCNHYSDFLGTSLDKRWRNCKKHVCILYCCHLLFFNLFFFCFFIVIIVLLLLLSLSLIALVSYCVFYRNLLLSYSATKPQVWNKTQYQCHVTLYAKFNNNN